MSVRTTSWWCAPITALCLTVVGCASTADAPSDADDEELTGSTDSIKTDGGKPSSTKRDAGATRDTGTAQPRVDGGASEDEPEPSNDTRTLLPFREGDTWTYKVSGSNGASMKVTTVGPMEKVGGNGPNKDKLAFKVTTTKGTTDRTESWQAVVGDSVVRYREIAYHAADGKLEQEEHWSPYKLHVHSDVEHTEAGAKWTETYEETKITPAMGVLMPAETVTDTAMDTWMVDAPKVSVTVPAGTFDAVVLIKASPSGQKTYWYVRGVGKVKETGGQTEELISYDVAE